MLQLKACEGRLSEAARGLGRPGRRDFTRYPTEMMTSKLKYST